METSFVILQIFSHLSRTRSNPLPVYLVSRENCKGNFDNVVRAEIRKDGNLPQKVSFFFQKFASQSPNSLKFHERTLLFYNSTDY